MVRRHRARYVRYCHGQGAEPSQPADAGTSRAAAENAHGNLILDVSSNGVTWPGGSADDQSYLYRFDPAADQTSRSPLPFYGVDVHAGEVATMHSDAGVTEVVSPTGKSTLRLEKGPFDSGLLRFNADGRYLAGYTTANESYHAVVADTRTGEVSAPSRRNAYPWIGWGYGDTLMVIQDYEGTNDGNANDRSRLLACDIGDRSCQRLGYHGIITLPGG